MNRDRIQTGINYTDTLGNSQDEDMVESLSEDMEQNILKLTRELFVESKVEKMKVNDPEYVKM